MTLKVYCINLESLTILARLYYITNLPSLLSTYIPYNTHCNEHERPDLVVHSSFVCRPDIQQKDMFIAIRMPSLRVVNNGGTR